MKTEPLYRRPLNEKQLAILHILYRFRFATTELLATSLGTKDKGKMNRRLKILVDQEYIGRKFESSYHLRGQHASFFLLPKGIRALKSLSNAKYGSTALHNLYKDKTASERFINHWLNVFGIYCQLQVHYGDRLRFFTQAELGEFEYFPQPLPDLYIRMDTGEKEKQYFLDSLEASQPLFVHVKRVKRYVEYAEDGDWEDTTGTSVPTVILVCDSGSLQNRLLKLIRRSDDDFDTDDLSLEVTSREQVINIFEVMLEA